MSLIEPTTGQSETALVRSMAFSLYDMAGAGPAASAFADLTDKATANIPSINTPTATALGLRLLTSSLGANVHTALQVAIGSAGAPILFNGAGGTPSSLTGTNITGIPAASILAGTFGVGSYNITPSGEVQNALRVNHSDGTARIQLGVLPAAPTVAAIYLGAVTPSVSNYVLASTGADSFLNATTSFSIVVNSATRLAINSAGLATFSGGLGAGAITASVAIAAATQANGVVIGNPTAATSGNQTWSPSLRLQGNQFASAASRTAEFLMTVVPVEQNFDHTILRFSTKHGADALLTLLDIRNYNGDPFIERLGSIYIGSTGANGLLKFQYNGTVFASLANGVSTLSKDLHFAWVDTATSDSYGAIDTGVTRGSAGVVKVTDGASGYGIVDASALRVSGTKVIGAQGAAVADVSAGAISQVAAGATDTMDKINLILARLRAHGIIAT